MLYQEFSANRQSPFFSVQTEVILGNTRQFGNNLARLQFCDKLSYILTFSVFMMCCWLFFKSMNFDWYSITYILVQSVQQQVVLGESNGKLKYF